MLLLLIVFGALGVLSSALHLSEPTARLRKIQVHLVPHSHQDPGWVRTIDEYYFGQVKEIYDSVLQEMANDKSRKFVIVEMAFFRRWYNALIPVQKDTFRKLLDAKQFEFVNGGWVVNDEACTTELAIMNQLSAGLSYLKESFQVRPRFGWQIDPFGHSLSTPYIFKKLGYDAVVLNRIHKDERSRREANHQMEFQWKAGDSEILAHLLDEHYSFPPYADFESNPPLGNEESLHKFCIGLVKQWHDRALRYPDHSIFLQLLGDDFRWQNATLQFSNWDRIIKHVNENSDKFGLELKYSTLSDYFDELLKRKISFSKTENLDFFPYADGDDAYWTGYYTSKAYLKILTRRNEQILRLAEMVLAKEAISGRHSNNLINDAFQVVREVSLTDAEVQHHDGITGTSKEYVSQQYKLHLEKGKEKLMKFLEIMNSKNGNLNGVYIYNTVDFDAVELVKIPVDKADYVVYDHNRNLISSTIVPALGFSGIYRQNYYLMFYADVAGLSKAFYFIESDEYQSKHTKYEKAEIAPPITASNDNLNLQSETTEGRLRMIVHQFGKSFEIDAFLFAYKSYQGEGQQSGAYIFRTNDRNTDILFKDLDDLKFEVMKTDLFEDIKISCDGFSQVFRLHKQGLLSDSIEVLSDIGPLLKDQEVVMKVFVKGAGHCRLNTLSNGMFGMGRESRSQNPAANFYPITDSASLSCEAMDLLLLTDRCLGASSQHNGEVELMLHRRTSHDDGRGVDEPLDDQSVVNSRVVLSFTKKDDSKAKSAKSRVLNRFPFEVLKTSRGESVSDKRKENAELEWLTLSVQITSLKDNEINYLFRFQHQLGARRNETKEYFLAKSLKFLGEQYKSLLLEFVETDLSGQIALSKPLKQDDSMVAYHPVRAFTAKFATTSKPIVFQQE